MDIIFGESETLRFSDGKTVNWIEIVFLKYSFVNQTILLLIICNTAATLLSRKEILLVIYSRK